MQRLWIYAHLPHVFLRVVLRKPDGLALCNSERCKKQPMRKCGLEPCCLGNNQNCKKNQCHNLEVELCRDISGSAALATK